MLAARGLVTLPALQAGPVRQVGPWNARVWAHEAVAGIDEA